MNKSKILVQGKASFPVTKIKCSFLPQIPIPVSSISVMKKCPNQ